MTFTCAVCGERHAGETRDVRLGLPEPIFLLEEAERDSRAWVGDDSAVLHDPGGDRFFVRALLELPIEDGEGYFGYGTWIEVGAEEFEALGQLWHDDEGWRSEPFPGTLANELSPYAATEGLPVRIQLRDVQLLPLVELGEADHELVEAQRRGISAHRVHELASTVA
jgi:hypothetical protein